MLFIRYQYVIYSLSICYLFIINKLFIHYQDLSNFSYLKQIKLTVTKFFQ